MRILHVNKFLYRRGGAESYMLDLAEAQRRRGHDVAFYAMEHPENSADPNEDTFPERMELNPPPAGLSARLKTAGQVLYRADARKGMGTMIERFRPDIVHLHNIYHQLSPSVLKPLAERGVPAVMTLHDYKLICPTYQLLDHGKICEACIPGKFREAVKRRCNGGSLAGSALSALELRLHTSTGAYEPIGSFLCPSQFLLEKMREGDVYPERLRHLPNFCDVSGVVPAESPGSGVIYAGRLSPEKGVDVLVRAAALMPSLSVTIAGDGPEREVLESLSRKLGIEDRIDFLGRIPMIDLHDRMRASSAVVVPSRWYENQPMTILEAYGCGRPVVASDLGGLSEQVIDGVTGALVPHEDPEALAMALRDVTDDPERAHEWGRNARRRAVAEYSLDGHVDTLEELYESLIRRPER